MTRCPTRRWSMAARSSSTPATPPGRSSTVATGSSGPEPMNAQASLLTPRVAVLGCGYWGRNLVRNFHVLGALAAVADPLPERISEMERLHGAPGRAVEAILA